MTTEERKPEPGPRQTVDLVVWPERGQGRLIWKNGPAFFVPDDGGPVVHLKKADHGGSSSNPKRSWQRAWTLDGRMVEVDLVERGESHNRRYSPLFGDGWLITERGPGYWERFEDDAGNVKVRFEMVELCVGRPPTRHKMQRSTTRMPKIDDPDEMNWSTYRTKDGTMLAFRRGGPPPPEGTFIPVRPDTYADLTPKARKAYDAAKLAHEKAIVGTPTDPAQLSLPIGSDR